MPKAPIKTPWIMPEWMEPYRQHFRNTGGNSVEDLVNGDTSPIINMPLFTLEACAQSQAGLLTRLHLEDLI